VDFKREVYRRALEELEPLLLSQRDGAAAESAPAP
jgi:hypothetical protein